MEKSKITSSEIKKVILKKCDVEKRNTYLGAKIRAKREKRRMTLEQVSSGICSVSYLSKLETGDSKVCDTEILKKILERLDINDIILNEDTKNECIQNVVIALLNDDGHLFNESIEKLSYDEDSHLYGLYRFFKNANDDNYQRAVRDFYKILSLKDSYRTSDYAIMVLVLIHSGLKSDAFLEAYELFNVFDIIVGCEYQYFNHLHAKLLLHASLRNGDFENAVKMLDIYKDYLLDKGYGELIHRYQEEITFRRLMSGFRIKTSINYNEKHMIENLMSGVRKDDINCLEDLDKFDSKKLMIYKIIALDHFKMEYRDYLDKYKYDGIKGEIIEALTYKARRCEEDYKIWLRDYFLPKAYEKKDRVLIEYLLEQYTEILARSSRYKEIYLAHKKYLSNKLD